ncbi:hypothetical protein M2271_004773 [Streptomyces sp. LBL]|nr:hypothetical protein [Streptomyces sp. LBL]
MIPGQATADRRFRFELAAHPGSPAQARRLTRARLTGWSVCEDTCDSAALVVSELVTNAIVHTASRRVVCELHDGEDLVRIAVRDEGCAPGEPQPSPQGAEEEHGRGLFLVDALCHAWGAQEHGPGLLVWAELPRKADTPRYDTASRNDLGWGARPKPGPSGNPGGATAQTHAGERNEPYPGPGTGIHADPETGVLPGSGTGIHPGTDTDMRSGAETEARPPHGAAASTGFGLEPRRDTARGTDTGRGTGRGTDTDTGTGGAERARRRGTGTEWA